MIQALIVDDEVLTIEGIKSTVNWMVLGIENVFTANSVKQAKEVILTKNIDLLLCDIEMPQENGLELIAWTQANYPKIKSIILTCHSNFQYAKQALKLGSLDYIVKPVPPHALEETIIKAIDKIVADNKLIEISRYGEYWYKNQEILLENFFADIINQTIASDEAAVKSAADERNIPYSKNMKIVPVLMVIRDYKDISDVENERKILHDIKHIAKNYSFGDIVSVYILKLSKNKLLAILLIGDNKEITSEDIKSKCRVLADICNEKRICSLSCYMGKNIFVHELHAMINKLYILEKSDVCFKNMVLTIGDEVKSNVKVMIPEMQVWALMLMEGSSNKFIQDVSNYLNNLVERNNVDADFLANFYQDFLQMVYSVFKQKGIQAHQCLGNNESIELFSNATSSVSNLILWIKNVANRISDYDKEVIKSSDNIVDKVKEYVQNHINQNISRDDIANYVHLNADYLTRVFKKETGVLLMDYIFDLRLKIAKELLLKTDMPIGHIACQIGYSNFSHFTKMFKKTVGMKPIEFRSNSRIEVVNLF